MPFGYVSEQVEVPFCSKNTKNQQSSSTWAWLVCVRK